MDVSLILLCTLYCAAYGAFCAFFSMGLVAERTRADGFFAFAGFACLASTAAFGVLSESMSGKAVSAGLFLLILFLGGLLFLTYAFYRRSGRVFHIEDVGAVMQTDSGEAYDFLKRFILDKAALGQLAAACLAFAAVFAAILFLSGGARLDGFTASALATAALLCGVLLLSRVTVFREAAGAAFAYRRNIAKFLQSVRELEKRNDQAVSKEGTGELYVIVLGESQSRDHMHVYSGVIGNTPWLDSVKDAKGWHLFRNAYASHTQTIYCVPQAFTDGRSLTGVTFPNCQNILTTSRLAGMKTAWISNQSDMGHTSSIVTAMAYLADRVVFSEKFSDSRNLFQTAPPDEVLLPFIERELNAAPEENRLIIIHLMGNHIPYLGRIPKDYGCQVWHGARYLGGLSKNRHVAEQFSHYVRSIEYTDQVLASIAAMLEKRDERPSCLIYFSDHGDDIAAEGAPHDHANFTWPMGRIPMFIHTSAGYEARYPERCRNLAANKDRLFTNDLIYDLYLGLAGLRTESYLERYDPSGGAYALDETNAVLAWGKKVADDPALQIPANRDFAGPPLLGAHRCNSLFKVRQVQRHGIRSFEVDLFYLTSEEGDDLYVGHDLNALAGGLNLREYLEWLGPEYDFLWLDVKNLNPDNADEIFALLFRLDKQYSLRARALIEGMFPAALAPFARSGWKTSLFLTTDELSALASAKDPEKTGGYFSHVVRMVGTCGIEGVSYDLRYDYLIRDALVPVMPEGCVYRSWRHSWKYTDRDLRSKAARYPHLSRLLVSFDTLFDL